MVRQFRLTTKSEERMGLVDGDFKPGEKWWRISDLLAEYPSATDVIDRALVNLSKLVKYPMERREHQTKDIAFTMFCPKEYLANYLDAMEGMGLISLGLKYKPVGQPIQSSIDITIAPKGWERIHEFTKRRPDSRQAFVAMWFNEQMETFYHNAIKPAVEQAGFVCKRIDFVQHNNKICDEIVSEIRKSRFVIADFTGQRGGVYFEAGYGMGLGLPVIFLVRKNDLNNLHFDTRQYNHIDYETPEELMERLRNRITATIH